jgi:hypothetical protein
MSRKHTLLMIAGCVLPMTAVAAVVLFRVQVSTVFLVAMLLLCPLVHVLMMKEHGSHEHHGAEQARTGDAATACHDMATPEATDLPPK